MPTYRSWQTELQQSILYHVDAGIWLAWSEDIVALAQPLEDHVPAQLQEERFLKMAQHPGRRSKGSGRSDWHAGSPLPFSQWAPPY